MSGLGRGMEIPSGGYLRQWRKTLGMTQAQLAKESGLTQSVIAKVELGTVDPRASTLRRLIAALVRCERPDRPHSVGDIMVEDVALHPQAMGVLLCFRQWCNSWSSFRSESARCRCPTRPARSNRDADEFRSGEPWCYHH